MIFFSNIANSWSERWTNPLTYVEAALLIAIVSLSIYIVFKLLHRRFAFYFYPISCAVVLLCFLLDLPYAFLCAVSVITIATIIFLFVNIGEIRPLVANPLQTSKNKRVKDTADTNDLYKKIESAVRWLSNSKTGAILTFERNTPLNDFVKTGTVINCPVSPEIIETIFYEGTRLHDGAIIIRGLTIVAAAVFYPPSTRGLTGKYGARHRAALGISEITDSITITVSEETGRITLAYAGILEPVVIDEFERTFKDAMSSTSSKEPKKVD